MDINIKTKNITLNSALQEFIDDKIGSLDKFLNGIEPAIVEVDISRTTNHHNKGDVFRAEVQIEVPGKLLRSESTKEDLRVAIVDVKNELQTQIKKYKETR
ncbi:MAG: ribosome-associated translation inhibitor RaiA [Candidatus Pacebacteria bacterium]|nr:ribosome-associated translation inhibitor RaiA [Candidatus Paceibacterota bacterium]